MIQTTILEDIDHKACLLHAGQLFTVFFGERSCYNPRLVRAKKDLDFIEVIETVQISMSRAGLPWYTIHCSSPFMIYSNLIRRNWPVEEVTGTCTTKRIDLHSILKFLNEKRESYGTT